MGIKFFDFNNDGRPDLFVTDMHSDMSEHVGRIAKSMKSAMKWPSRSSATRATSIFGNSFFHKAVPESIREVSDALGVENYCPVGSERRRHERRRLGRHLHRLRHELPVPLRGQLAAMWKFKHNISASNNGGAGSSCWESSRPEV